MVWVVRKISQAKWLEQETLEPGAIAADAVTTDLRTNSNGLSLWICEDPTDRNELHQVVIALGSVRERPDKIDLVWLNRGDVESAGIRLNETPGNTNVRSLQSLHLDAVCLDLSRLNKPASLCADGI